MGRPLNKHTFTALSTISPNPARANPAGTIGNATFIKQKDSTAFRVSVSAVQGNCLLVDKASASLLLGEMLLTAKPSGTAFRVKKITNKFLWDYSNVKYRWSMVGTVLTAVAM